MKKYPVWYDGKWNRIGSWRIDGDGPFTIAFVFQVDGKKGVLKGRYDDIEVHLKRYTIPLMVKYTFWYRGKVRATVYSVKNTRHPCYITKMGSRDVYKTKRRFAFITGYRPSEKIIRYVRTVPDCFPREFLFGNYVIENQDWKLCKHMWE